MRLFTPTQSRRLNEVMGFLFLASGILVLLSFASFHPTDSSWNTVTGRVHTENLIGPIGAYMADIFLQAFGLAAFLFPVLIFGLGWKWIRSEEVSAPLIRLLGSALLLLSACGAAALLPEWRLFEHSVLPGGATGFLVAGLLRQGLNLSGAAVVLATCLIVSIYLVSTFTLASLERLFVPVAAFFTGLRDRWRRWLENRREAALEKQRERRQAAEAKQKPARQFAGMPVPAGAAEVSPSAFSPPIVPEPIPTQRTRGKSQPEAVAETMPWDDPAAQSDAESADGPDLVAPD
ncbi:MAG: DNA translocase FtsK 4TM domain-containing protein, partial [Acidobacteriota bacterium]